MTPCRSRARLAWTCGSTLAIGLELDGQGAITRLGVRAHACAIGQAAAFARGATGAALADLCRTRDALEQWLDGEAACRNGPVST
jgi:NifU-like protein involved in Fe-S cluster formation